MLAEPVAPVEAPSPRAQTTKLPPSSSKPVEIFIKRLSEETPAKTEHHLPLPPVTTPVTQVRSSSYLHYFTQSGK